MKTRLKKIGNSRGITLSKTLLELYEFEDEVEVVAQENGLLIMPIRVRPREQWDEHFKKAKKEGILPIKLCWRDLRIPLTKKNGHGR